MNTTYIVKIGNLVTIASGSSEDWKDTFAVLKAEGVDCDAKKFSDYTGPTVPCDQLLYFASFPDECPVVGPKWMF